MKMDDKYELLVYLSLHVLLRKKAALWSRKVLMCHDPRGTNAAVSGRRDTGGTVVSYLKT
jgi:hypothetical protein